MFLNRLILLKNLKKNLTNNTNRFLSTVINSQKEDKKTDISGSEYFKKIVTEAYPGNQLSDSSKKTSHNIELESNSKQFAKRFLIKQIEHQKKHSSKQSNNESDSKEPIKQDQVLKKSSTILKNWESELNKSKTNKKQSKNEKFKQFRYKNIQKIEPDETTAQNQLIPEQEAKHFVEPVDENSKLEELDTENLSEEQKLDLEIRNLRPRSRPVVYNLAYFVNKNEVVKKLVEMGVFIRKWDKDPQIGSFILNLNLERDIKPHLIFLHDIGIPPESHSFVITKNPYFFKDSIQDLNTRIEYLKSKNFNSEAIKKIVVQAPKWLSLSVNEVDTKLGWFQKEFNLSGPELREIVTERPKLITLPLQIASNIKFGLKEFLTYDDKQLKTLITSFPKLFTKDFKQVESNFIFLTQVVKMSHDELLVYPPVLLMPLLDLKSRYAYLKYLNRIQFDPSKPNFVSLKMLCEHDENIFCQKVAKTSVDDYKKFLKTV